MKKVFRPFGSALLVLLLALGCTAGTAWANTEKTARLIASGLAQTTIPTLYDSAYRVIPYPNGDVPPNLGVCADVIIRAYRALGLDLQQLVHEDMQQHFTLYPKLWGLKRPDSNIDHRRVPNLQVFFRRHGTVLPITRRAGDYRPGDIVTWNLRAKGSLPHIGIVSNRTARNGNPLIIHNIGLGPQLQDMLFAYAITGYYRYGLDG